MTAAGERVGGPNRDLVALRESAGLSQQDLADELNDLARNRFGRSVELTRKTVGRWERGEVAWPQPFYRRLLAQFFGVGADELGFARPGASAGPPESSIPDTDVRERFARVLERPQRVDRVVVAHLAVMLDGQRRLEDVVGARQVLPATLAHLGMIDDLARAARSGVRAEVLAVGAQWRQFAAWQSQDLGRPAEALAHHDRASEAAHEVGDDNMVVTVLSLKSHLAWSQRDPARAVGLAAAGRRDPGGATPGVLGLIAQQEARGHALDGDADRARRLLDRSEELSARAADRPDGEPPWTYHVDPGRSLYQRGVVELELGEYDRAVDLISRSLAVLPASYRRDRARYGAKLALAAAHARDVERAAAAGRDAFTLAREVGSSHALSDLRSVRAVLDRRVGHPAVREFDGYPAP